MEGDRDQDGQVRGRCSLYVEQDQRQTWLTNDMRESRKSCPAALHYSFTIQLVGFLFSYLQLLLLYFDLTLFDLHKLRHCCSTETLSFHIIQPASHLLCLSAFTWIDIANCELCPTTGSLLHDDHALQQGHRPPLWGLHPFSTHPTGLRLRHPIDRLFSNWT